MPQTLPNNAIVPIGTDGWGLTAAVRKALASARVIIPTDDAASAMQVVTALATEGVTASAAAPLYFQRRDQNRIMWWDGSTWGGLTRGPWLPLTVDTAQYTVTQTCSYRVVGEMVEVVGRVQPKTATGTAGYLPQVTTIPTEARPGSMRMAGHLAYTGGAAYGVEVYVDPTGALAIRTGGAIPATADIPINIVYGRG